VVWEKGSAGVSAYDKNCIKCGAAIYQGVLCGKCHSKGAIIHSLEEEKPHVSGMVKCLACNHLWVGVVTAGVIWLECPSCKMLRGRLINHVERDVTHWVCKCGNDLFYCTNDGFYCPNCGEFQR
jgi:hypothetical protein